MLIHLLQIVIGLALLYYGGEFLITGSIRIAKRFNISPFIIGATVIGFGTSAPELAVCILAAMQEAPELAMGNVIGSNIANAGLVLGLTAICSPIFIEEKRFQEESPALMVATILVTLLAWDFYVGRLEGMVMVVLLVVYLWKALRKKDSSGSQFHEDAGTYFSGRGLGAQFFLVFIGLILLIFGADRLVDGGVAIARIMGMSEWFIGISIVALGTSLPEIVSSIFAAKRGHGEMAIGNIFGSNIFNILMVLGTTAIIKPLEIKEPIHPDLLLTTGLTCFLLILIRVEHKLSKLDGVLLLTCYIFYIGLKGIGVI